METTSFKEYSSINSTRTNGSIKYVTNIVPADVEWIATEKVHGANFSFTTDGTTIKWGKRTSFLTDEEHKLFFNCKYAIEKYEKDCLSLFTQVKNYIPDTKLIRVYGELYGGKYTDVKTSHLTKVSNVQVEVLYSPNIEFIIFDIYVEFDNTSLNTYLDLQLVQDLCRISNLPVVKTLHIDLLSNLLKLDPSFETTIPEIHGLPKIDNNFAEGYVFRPITEYTGTGGRVILKHKSDRFLEKHKHKKIELKNVGKLSAKHLLVAEHLCQYVTETRLQNVYSKLLSTEGKNLKRVCGLLCKDAIEDGLKDLSEEDVKVYHDEKTKINVIISNEAFNVVMKNQG